MCKDTISERVRTALENHNKGYNCAQAVICAFSDLVEMDEETLFRVAEGLGLGMGSMDGTCGAISAAAVLAGLKCSTANLNKPDSKAVSSQASKECVRAFKEKNGSVVCRELKGLDTKQILRTCDGCIADAAAIIEETLFSQNDN